MRRSRSLVLSILLFLVLVAAGSVLLRFVPVLGPKANPAEIKYNQIRLEIINASGIDKQGKRAMVYLRELGFDVYDFRTGKKEIEKTIIVDRVDKAMINARTTAQALTIRKKIFPFLPWSRKLIPAISCDIDSTLYLEATVMLGKDYQQFIPKTLMVF